MHVPLPILSWLAPLALLASAPPLESEAVPLKLVFRPGAVSRFRVTMEERTQYVIGDRQRPGSNLTVAVVLSESIREASAEGTGSISLVYQAIRVEVNSPKRKLVYDSTDASSADAASAEFGKKFENLLGAKVDLKMDSRGQLVELAGAQEMLDRAKTAARKDTEFEAVSALLFGEEALRNFVELNQFPAKPVDPGESWSRNAKWTLALDSGVLRFSMENVLKPSEVRGGRPCARIEIASGIAFEPGKARRSDTDPVVDVAGSEGRATQWFSTELGRIVESAASVKVVMKMVEPEEEGTDPGPAVTIKSDRDTRVLLLGKDDPPFERAVAAPDPPKK